MKAYMLSPLERIKDWRNFRQSLSTHIGDDEQILHAMNYWQQYPIIDRYLDPDFPENWPTPWELINELNICPIGIPYLIGQTLLLSDDRWTNNRLELIYIDDKSQSKYLMLLVIDNKKAINYSIGEIINFDIIIKSCIIHNRYNIIFHQDNTY